jgi:CubicO group peptidase (beta-lactamase class C family)
MINKNYSKILENNIPIIIFIFGNPYSSLKIKRLSESSAVFLLYSYVYSSQRAAFKALCSSIEICGKLPINLKYQKKEVTENIIPARKYTLVTKSDSFREFVEIDTYIKQSIHKKIFPGGVLLIAHNGEIIYHKSYGYYDYNSDSEIVQTDTPYDIASLTKVLATTPAILKLYDKNQLDLNQPLSDFYPNLYKKNLGSATINDLLLHQSGLPAWKPLYKSSKTKDQLIENVLLTKLEHKRKEKCVYSDLGFILLGDLIEKITGYSLDTFCRDYLFNPLGLKSIRYISLLNYERTITKTKKLFPPTGLDEYRKRIIQGEVHDTNAWLMGGIAGHAGLFSEAKDVAAMGQLFINNGIYNARRVLRYKAIQLTLTNQSPKISNRFLGWDTPSPKSSSGKYLSKGSFGHLAFTGPSIWIDSDRQLIITFLCNRTHPNPQANQMKSFRPRLHDIIIEALKANNLIK